MVNIEIVAPLIVKSLPEPDFNSWPFNLNSKDLTGLGLLNNVKVAFTPFIVPEGVSS